MDALSTGSAPAKMAPRDACVAMADGVEVVLRLARGASESGRQVDLAGLDTVIGRLCAQCLDLPPDIARSMRPRLATLLAELDVLDATFRAP